MTTAEATAGAILCGVDDVSGFLNDRQKKALKLARLTGEEAAQFNEYGDIEVTVTRACELLMISKAKMGESLDKPVTRQQVNNYNNSSKISARVNPEKRTVKIVTYYRTDQGETVNEGTMP